MTAPKGLGTWLLLSKVLAGTRRDQADACAREILLDVTTGKERIRYLNIDELPPRTEAAGYILSAPDDSKSHRADYRYDPLPPALLRHGRINWIFSSLTLGELSIHHIELFFPGVAPKADAPPLAEPKRGRPTLANRIKEEAERLQQKEGHRYPTRASLARAVMRRVSGAEEKTIYKHLDGVWVAGSS